MANEQLPLRTMVFKLTSGEEVIADVKYYGDDSREYRVEFPHVIRWVTDQASGNLIWKLVPYLFSANMQTNVPIRNAHVISMADANETFRLKFKDVTTKLVDDESLQVQLRRHMEERYTRSQ